MCHCHLLNAMCGFCRTSLHLAGQSHLVSNQGITYNQDPPDLPVDADASPDTEPEPENDTEND